MKPNSIYLIRHGESEGNIDSSIYQNVPDWKVPLTTKGIEQAKKAGQHLYKNLKLSNYQSDRKPVQFYCSPWYRARETIKTIREQMGLSDELIKEDPRIREQDWGNYQEEIPIRKVKIERHIYGSFFYRMPNGESGADVYDRVTTFIDTLYRDFDDPNFPENVIIGTHGITLKVILMRWLHWTVETFDSYKTPENCCIIKMSLQDNQRYKLITSLKLYSKS